MAWNTLFPDGTKSVALNETIGQANTTYIEQTMGDSSGIGITNDHFWNIGSDEDGHHRQVQMKNFEDTYSGAPTEPSLGAQMASVAFTRLKTVAESPTQQDSQPFFRNSSQIMQVLGIRAMALFELNPGVVMKYSHNITSVVRNGVGDFTATFATAVPSDFYLVLGGGISNSTNPTDSMVLSVAGDNSFPAGIKNNMGFAFYTRLLQNITASVANSPLFDPNQAWFIAFGG